MLCALSLSVFISFSTAVDLSHLIVSSFFQSPTSCSSLSPSPHTLSHLLLHLLFLLFSISSYTPPSPPPPLLPPFLHLLKHYSTSSSSFSPSPHKTHASFFYRSLLNWSRPIVINYGRVCCTSGGSQFTHSNVS